MKFLILSALLFLIPALALAEPTATMRDPVVAYDLLATVPVDTATSNAVDLRGNTLVGVFLPSTFDGTVFTLTGSDTLAGTYVAIQDGAGAAVTVTSAASKYASFPNPLLLTGVRFVKIVTTTTQTTTSTIITLAVRPLY